MEKYNSYDNIGKTLLKTLCFIFMTVEVFGLCQWPDEPPGWGNKGDTAIAGCPFRVKSEDAYYSPGTTFHLLASSSKWLVVDAWLYGTPKRARHYCCAYPQKQDIIICNYPAVRSVFDEDIKSHSLQDL